MTKFITITTTTNSLKEAARISSILLSERLISCSQVTDIKSAYYWNGKIETAKEYLLKVKTKKELYKEVEKTILKYHSYDVPEIVSYDIIDGHDDYLQWIEKETR